MNPLVRMLSVGVNSYLDLEHEIRAHLIECKGSNLVLDKVPGFILPKDVVAGVQGQTGFSYGTYAVEGNVLKVSPIGSAMMDRNLVPTYDFVQRRFTYHYHDKLIQNWLDAGVLVEETHDRIKLCPKCKNLPTFRLGCRRCGSSNYQNDRLIHHFTCAHVDMLSEFESNGKLTCPKCRMTDMVVGADFEWVTGPYQCKDCQWQDTDLDHVANCLVCGFRFPSQQAAEVELKAYHVDRFDPLAYAQAC